MWTEPQVRDGRCSRGSGAEQLLGTPKVLNSRNNDPTSAALNPEPVTFHRDGAVKDLETEGNLHCVDGFSAVIGGPCDRGQGPELEKESKEVKLLALKREKESPAKRWMQFLEAGKSQSMDFPRRTFKRNSAEPCKQPWV